MGVLLDVIKKLIEEWLANKKSITEIITGILNTIKQVQETMEEFEKTAKSIQETMNSIKSFSDESRILIVKLQKDHDELKEALENNFWLKLFGFKTK